MKVSIITLGCKTNQYESDAMSRILSQRGYEVESGLCPADIYVINSCAVTNTAVAKSRQTIAKARKLSPNACVVFVGCAGEMEGKPENADIFLGNREKSTVADAIDKYIQNGEKEEKKCFFSGYDELGIVLPSVRTRAQIKIQDGCNNFCSYCIIPYVRGRSVSRREEDILAEVIKQRDFGIYESVLTGIDLNAYGNDTGTSLIELLEKISAVCGDMRIRIGSLDPAIVTDEFAYRASKIKALCPHFHISLQSGSDRILKLMNRHYTANEFCECINRLNKYFDLPGITTDVIVGFPGETEEDFEETRNIVRKSGFLRTHVFPYSPRKGTAAERMISTKKLQPIPKSVKSHRVHILENDANSLTNEYLEKKLNTNLEVIFETAKDDYVEGYSAEYIQVRAGKDTPLNIITNVRWCKAENGILYCIPEISE